MSKIPYEVGRTVRVSKTVGETDVYLFAGITGDFSVNHVNEEYMKKTIYGQRIAHGVLSLGFASTASSKFVEDCCLPSVSAGYDHVRFIKPVFIGDTLTVTYTCERIEEDQMKAFSSIKVTNQRGEVCMVATHILKFFEQEI